MLIRLALCMTSIFFSVSPASILTARMRQFSRVSKGGKTFSRMTFHSFSPREAEMLSVSPDENLAIPREKSRSTHVTQTVWCMIHLLVGVFLWRGETPRLRQILRATKCDKLSDLSL